MKKLTFLLAGALAFASVGCKKKSAAPAGPDCAQAINHSMELSKAEMQKMGNDEKMLQKMTDLGMQHCKDDKWPADALKCMVDAKTMNDAQACYGKLSKDQQDKMNKAAMELVMPAGGGGDAAGSGSADGAGSAAAGSDAGSAAGSAAAPK